MRQLAALLALPLVACAPDSGGAGATSNPLWNTSWIAYSVAGQPVVPPGAITLTFQDGSVGGSSGCNTYGGDVTVKGNGIVFGSLASTMMACAEEGRMRQEAAYGALLRDAVSYERPSPQRLEIVAKGGRRAVFTAKR